MANTTVNILKPICEPATKKLSDRETGNFYVLEFNDWDAGLDEKIEFNTELEKMKESMLHTDEKQMIVSFDSEWQVEDDNRRHILSYQFTVYFDGQVKEYMFVPKTENALRLEDVLGVLANDFNIHINQGKGNPTNVTTPVYLLAHNSLCDITTLTDFANIYKDLTGDKEVFSKKPSKIYENRKDGTFRSFNVSVIGTMNHFQGSLAKLGASLGQDKVKLEDGVIEHMKDLRENDFDKFCEYGMGDTRIIMKWYLKNFRDMNIPITTTSLGERLMVESLGGERNAEHLRGVQTVWEESPTKEKNAQGKIKKYKKEKFVSELAKEVNQKGKEAYLGGWNTCTQPGIYTEKTFDFDLSGAYPTAASLLPNIDYQATSAKFEMKDQKLDKSIADKFDYNNIGFARVDFEFPEDVKFPCIPVSDKKGWVYTRTGEDVDVTWPEIKLAVNMGANVFVRELKIYKEEIDPQTSKPISYLGNSYKFFTENREEAKQVYGKGSPQEQGAKLFGNGVYGKLSQGMKEKTIRDVASNEMKAVKTSKLTSPAHASHLTALVRCALCSTMEELDKNNFECYSVTTDGFISNATLEDVRNCDMFGLKELFQSSSMNLRGNDIIWEEKHHQERLLNVSTRVNYGLDVTNHQVDKGVEASTGYTGDNFVRDYLERGENGITVTSRVFPSFTKMVYDGRDYIPEIVLRNVLYNPDYKRYTDFSTMKDMTVEYEGKDYNVVNFDTKPYESIQDWLDVQKTVDRSKTSLLTSADYKDLLSPDVKLEVGDLRSEILNGIYFMSKEYGYNRIFDSVGEDEVIKSMNTAARNLGCQLDLTPTLLHELQVNNKFDEKYSREESTDVFISKVKESVLGKLERSQNREHDPEPSTEPNQEPGSGLM